jgi:hypothetical protein
MDGLEIKAGSSILINSIENPLIIIFPNPFYWKNRNTRRLGKISIV